MTREPSAHVPDATIRAAITKDTPIGTADALWFDLSDRLDTTSQRRRRLFVIGSPAVRVAFAAIALIAVTGGAVYLLVSAPAVGVPPPTVQPTPTATPEPSSARSQAAVPTDWTSYTSSRFSYTMDYPAAWDAIPATVDWPPVDFPDKFANDHDVFQAFSTAARLTVASVPLKAGKTSTDWITQLDGWNLDHSCQISDTRTIKVDGVDARQQEGVCMGTDHLLEVVMADDSRFYQINLFGSSGPFTDADRGTLERALASFRFVWTSYTSSRLGYTAAYPADWRVTPATADWPTIGLPEKGGPSMDGYGPSQGGTGVVVASVPLKPGKDAAYWIGQLDSQNAAFCNQTSNRHSITVDGVNMRQEDQVCAQTIHTMEVLGASKSRFFEIIIVRDLSDGSPLTDAERATFDRFLASFRFGG